jgi:hypothetical protein
VLHAKPCPIGARSHYSACHGICNPPALLLCPARAILPQTPTPQTPTISARWALKAYQASDPHTQDLRSTGPHPPGMHRPAQYPLCKPEPLRSAKPGIHTHTIPALLGAHVGLHRPAQACIICAFLSQAPKACHISDPQTFMISARPCPQACRSLLCWAMPPRPGKLKIHRHSRSPPGHAFWPAQASTITAGLHRSRLHRPARSQLGACL